MTELVAELYQLRIDETPQVSLDSILVEFRRKAFMPNSVKGLANIKKGHIGLLSTVCQGLHSFLQYKS